MKKLKFLLALWVGKIIVVLTKILSKERGTNVPGVYAFKISKDFISNFSNVDYNKVIFVTGTNGKSTTNNMIVHCMRSAGKTVATNLEGANLITGIATAMIKYSSLLGKMKTEYMVFETDERYLQYIYKLLPAKNICITNIQKDQVQRNGEPDYIYKKITNSQLEGMSNAQKLYVLDQTRVIENKQDNFYINKPFNVFYRAVPNLDERAEYKTSKDLIDVVKRDSTEIKELYEIKDMNDLIRFELLKFVSSDIEFKECENCHQYFIPVNRKDEIYCNRPIKGTEKTCKDVGAMNRHKEKAGDIPGEKEYWRVYKRYKYKADRKIISKSEFNQWNYMALELKQECAEGEITVDDMLKRIEVFENRKKVGKKYKN